MINSENPVRVIVFYKINIFQEIISCSLENMLSDYSLHVTIVETADKLLEALAENEVDLVFTEFNYLLNHKEWSTETSSRLNMLCKTRNVRRVLFVPELHYGLLKKVLEMKFELTISLQDDMAELKKELQTLMQTQEQKPVVSTWLKGAMRAGARSRSVLSAREWEVIHLIVEGYTITEIASYRNRSVSTIATQKHNAMKKLNISSHSELIKYLNTVGKMGS